MFSLKHKTHEERPDPRIQELLKGEKPPEYFEGDGCTLSPNLWFREACRYHDWEYNRLRKLKPHTYLWRMARYGADKDLRHNIEILTTYRIDGTGGLVKETHWTLQRKFGYWLAKVYYWAVRKFGAWAAHGNEE